MTTAKATEKIEAGKGAQISPFQRSVSVSLAGFTTESQSHRENKEGKKSSLCLLASVVIRFTSALAPETASRSSAVPKAAHPGAARRTARSADAEPLLAWRRPH